MLFLKRKVGDTIHIGEGPNEVVITVDKMNQDEVNLGIKAPRSMSIDRGEVRRKKLQEGNNDAYENRGNK